MKKLIVSILLIAFVSATATAQGKRIKPTDRMAMMQAKSIAKELGLNDRQKKAVFELYKKAEAQNSVADVPRRRRNTAAIAQKQENAEKVIADGLKKILTAAQFKKWEAKYTHPHGRRKKG